MSEILTWAQTQRAPSSTAKFILLRLAPFADADGCAWAKVDRIAAETQKSIRTVQRGLRELEAASLIIPTGKWHWTRSATGQAVRVPVYRFPVERRGDTHVTPSTRRGDTHVTPRGDTHVTPYLEKADSKHLSPERGGDDEEEALLFAKLGAVWSDRIKRGATSWPLARAAFHALTAEDQRAVVEAAGQYAAARPWGSKGPPSLHRWLAEEFWRDVASAPAPNVALGWAGPPEIRAAVVEAHGEPFTVSYLDPAAWLTPTTEAPHGAVVPRNGYAGDRLAESSALRGLGIKISEKAPRHPRLSPLPREQIIGPCSNE